jgi:hypothetical protein
MINLRALGIELRPVEPGLGEAAGGVE